MELRQAFEAEPDLVILWAMPSNQINARSLRFIDETGVRGRIRFLSDPASAVIDQLGLRRPNPEAIEAGVPQSTTFLIDRQGIVRFADARADYHIWLDPSVLLRELAALE